MPVNHDTSALHIIETADQRDDGGFAGTGRADKCNGFAGADIKADIAQNACFVIIAERNMVKGYIAFDRRHLCDFFTVSDFGRCVHDFKYTLCACDVRDQLIIEVGEVHDRVPEHGNIGTESDQKTDLLHTDSQNCDTDIEHGNGAQSPAEVDDGVETVSDPDGI